jgi:hypothetical protein
LVTIHPSALLRAPRGREYDAAYALFVRDLKNINGRGRRSRQATAATPRRDDSPEGAPPTRRENQPTYSTRRRRALRKTL